MKVGSIFSVYCCWRRIDYFMLESTMFLLIVLLWFKVVLFCIISGFRKWQKWRSRNITTRRKLSNISNYSKLIWNTFWQIFFYYFEKMVLIHSVLNFFFINLKLRISWYYFLNFLFLDKPKISCYLEKATLG